jgi:hypothetical protein
LRGGFDLVNGSKRPISGATVFFDLLNIIFGLNRISGLPFWAEFPLKELKTIKP